jgi:hypothetical protein
LHGAFDQRYRGGEMGMDTWATAAIVDLLCLLFGCDTLKLALGIEALEDESAIIAEQLLHPHGAKKDTRLVIILLNPLTLTPWALHPRTILPC